MSIIPQQLLSQQLQKPIKKIAIILLAAIIYFVLPIDAIPDYIPVIGYLDDAYVLSETFGMFRQVIDDFKNAVNFQLSTSNELQNSLDNT